RGLGRSKRPLSPAARARGCRVPRVRDPAAHARRAHAQRDPGTRAGRNGRRPRAPPRRRVTRTVSDTFQDKVALVTGAASGIGAASARHLASLGAHVVSIDLSEVAVRKVADETNGTA